MPRGGVGSTSSLLVGAFVDTGDEPRLVRLGAADGVLPFRQGRLSTTQVRELAQASGALSADECEEVVERAEGLPLAAAELASAAQRGPGSVPAGFSALVDARLDALDEAERSVLAAAAVAGGDPPDWGLASAVVGLPDVARDSALQHAVRLQLLAVDDTDLRWPHGLVRDAARQRVLLPQRQDLARRIAELLLLADAESTRAAELLLAAGEVVRACALYCRSAESAVRSGALHHLQRLGRPAPDREQPHPGQRGRHRVGAGPFRAVQQLRRTVGLFPWDFGADVARGLRVGRVFLVGDAGQRTTPRGATGMNTGIAAGHNLGWKLAWVARGWAGPGLLDSYEVERGPIGRAPRAACLSGGGVPAGLHAGPVRRPVHGDRRTGRRTVADRGRRPGRRRGADRRIGRRSGPGRPRCRSADRVRAAGRRRRPVRPDGYVAWCGGAEDSGRLAEVVGAVLGREVALLRAAA